MPASANLKHKEKNAYRFKSFSKLLKEINIDVIHQIRRVEQAEDTEDSSRFHECLKKWKDLDLTSDFVSFHQEVSPKCQTYKFVVYYKNDIFDILEKHLQIENTLALQALLELLVALCIDLGQEFYPQFSKFFSLLCQRLKAQSAKQLEWVFTAISLLFRHLWRYMISDLENILKLYSNLLFGQRAAHIGSFAAESVSFLLRKAHDHKSAIKPLFSILKDNPKSSSSISQVLFHMLKTSQNQFHSSAGNIFPVILSFLKESSGTVNFSETMFLAINSAVHHMANHTRKEYADPIWQVFLSEIEQNKDNLFYLNYLFCLLNTWCEMRYGSRVVCHKQLVNLCHTCACLLKGKDESECRRKLSLSFCKLISIVVNANKSGLDADSKRELVTMITGVEMDFTNHEELWKSVFFNSNFDELYHRTFLQFCQRHLQCEALQFRVIQLLVHCSLGNLDFPRCSTEVLSFLPRTFDFSYLSRKRKELHIGDIIKSLIERNESLYSLWYNLTALLSIKPLPYQIENIVEKVFEDLVQNEDHEDVSLSVLYICCLVLLKLDETQTFAFVSEKAFALLTTKYCFNMQALMVLEIILSKNRGLFLRIAKKEKKNLLDALERNISSPDAKLRPSTFLILQHIDPENHSVYQHCLNADNTPATVQECRGKVLHLSKLQCHNNSLPEFPKKVVIRYLFSNLFINFSSLWKPVQDLLCSYAVSDKDDVFWCILIELLQSYSDLVQDNPVDSDANNSNCDLFTSVVFGSVWSKRYVLKVETNFAYYRLLLWKTLCKLPQPDVLEKHNAILFELILKFLQRDYCLVDKQFLFSSTAQHVEMVDMQKNSNSLKKQDAIQLLVTMFEVLARFKNPSALRHSNQFKKLYSEFLTHPEMSLQKAAMDCIFTYNNNVTNKYKDLLLSFLDDKKFHHSITHFDINSFSEEDRAILLPVLLKILLGKFKSKKGLYSGGKSLSCTKRSLIIRFLNVVSEDELRDFTQMALEPYLKYINDLLQSSAKEETQVRQNYPKVMPIGKQNAAVQTIELLITENSQRLPSDIYPYLFHLLLSINASNVKFIDSVFPDCKKHLLPAVRSATKKTSECILTLLKLWPDTANLSEADIDLLFDVQVWPQLHKLADESAGKPGVLLKMICVFVEKLKFLPFLVKSEKSNVVKGYSLMSEVSLLLNSTKVSEDVSSFIINFLLGMFYENPDKSSPKDPSNVSETLHEGISLAGRLAVDLSLQTESRFQFASAALQPYIGKVLLFFINRMKKNKKGYLLPKKQLEFLFELSNILTDKSLLSDLGDLLLSHVMVASNSNREHSDASFSMALQLLSNLIREPKHVPKLSELLSKTDNGQTRLSIVSILKKACENHCEYEWTCDIVERLNACNKGFLDTDFESRLIAFQDVIAYLKGNDSSRLFENDCVLFLPIMHSCLHIFLTYFSDISMRESVFRFFECTMSRISELLKENTAFSASTYQKIVKNMLLNTIHKAIQSKDEACRNEGIKLLAKTVCVFPNEPNLVGLNILINKSDPENDVFENVRHIQLHRRARAFRKLAAIIKKQHSVSYDEQGEEELMRIHDQPSEVTEQQVISSTTATKYLLPIAINTLYTCSFTDALHLRDACIDLVQSCAAIMSWPAYRKLLLKNINSLRKLEISRNIVCAILDVFSFDLRNYSTNLTCENPSFAADNDITAMEIEPTPDVQLCSAQRIMNEAEAKVIVSDIGERILPKLKDLMSSKKDSDEHKMAGVENDIENCKKRLPLAIPIVSLLHKLPYFLLKSNLPSLLLKIFEFFKSKLHDVRSIAKDTTVKIVKFLGTSHLLLMLKQLKASLRRGFQRHVLVNVTCAILNTLAPMATVGSFDECLRILQEILNEGLFGETASEKSVKKLRAKTPEAKGRSKAFSAYSTLAKFLGKANLTALLEPLKTKLDQTHKHAVKLVVQEVLNEIASGLINNTDFRAEDVLAFSHGIITENVSVLFPSLSQQSNPERDNSRKPESCLILSNAPTRYGSLPTKKITKTNLHILVEFAMKLLYIFLKRQAIQFKKQTHLQMLDPLIGSLASCLSSTHLQSVINSTRCFTKLFMADLPSLSTYSKHIIPSLFKILRDHTKGAGNQELAKVSFKCLGKLCVSEYGKNLTDDQLQVLLSYAEEDLHDDRRQSESFVLIKSVLQRGLKCTQLTTVIKKVEKIAIQSHGATARTQARTLCLYFLLNYPLTRSKLYERLEFVLAQLNFEFEDGRMSVLEMLSSIVTNFPNKTLQVHAGVIFIPTAAVIINDESAKCRKSAAIVIKQLIKKLDQAKIDDLFSYVMHWYSQDMQVLHERLGAMLLCVFIEVEETEVHRHLSKILQSLRKNLEKTMKNIDTDESVKATDHTLFHHLSVALSILRCCSIHLSKYQDDMLALFDDIESLLTHPHDWVQLISSQIFGCIFATWECSDLSPNRANSNCFYKSEELEMKLFNLTKSFCTLFKSHELQDRLAEQILKNLLFLMRVFDNKHFSRPSGEQEDEDYVHKSILYTLRRLLVGVKYEQTRDRKAITKRCTALKFCAALCINIKNPERVLHLLLDPVYRGMNATTTIAHDPEAQANMRKLKRLSEEVLEVVKTKVGSELFTLKYQAVTQSILDATRKRKAEQARQLVLDPIKAASLKIKRNEKKKELLKRKFALKRPERGKALVKRQKRS